MSFLKKWRLALGIGLCAVIGVMASAYPTGTSSALEDLPGTQDLRNLDQRINSLEQRLYSIDSRLNRLEQSATSQRTPVLPDARDQEISLLRRDIQTLQLRLSDIECGLIKLDERTTTSAVREARRSSGARITDPCRLNPAEPLRFSTRQ